MADILDVAQKTITDAAQAAAQTPVDAPPVPPSQPTPPTPPLNPIEEKPASSPPTPEESALVDAIINQAATLAPEPPPPAPEPTPTPTAPVMEEKTPPPAEPAPTQPPPPPHPKLKKKIGGKFVMIAAALLLVATIPLGVLFVSQQKQLADVRSRASASCSQNQGLTNTQRMQCEEQLGVPLASKCNNLTQSTCATKKAQGGASCCTWTTPTQPSCNSLSGSCMGSGVCRNQGGQIRSTASGCTNPNVCCILPQTTPTPIPTTPPAVTCASVGGGCNSRDNCDRIGGTINSRANCGSSAVCCIQPASTPVPTTPPASTSTPPPSGGPVGGASTDTVVTYESLNCVGNDGDYRFDEATARCTTPNKCTQYSECCGQGMTRSVAKKCMSNGTTQYFITHACGPKAEGDPNCGTYQPGGQTCAAGQFFWAQADGGDNACHDITQQPNPGGGVGACGPSGCSLASLPGGCIKKYTCKQSELSPQGFCLINESDAPENTSYQQDANNTCSYIQLDAFNAQRCQARNFSDHNGTYIYRPANPNGCQPTPTPTPPAAPRCDRIKMYTTSGQEITDPSTLRPGDQVILAVRGDNATRGHFRVNGAPPEYTEATDRNNRGEFTLPWTVPTGITNFTIEAEVFIDGNWR